MADKKRRSFASITIWSSWAPQLLYVDTDDLSEVKKILRNLPLLGFVRKPTVALVKLHSIEALRRKYPIRNANAIGIVATGRRNPSAASTQEMFVAVHIPEQNEGKFIQEVMWVDSRDVNEVRKALAGRGLGTMGTELDETCFGLGRPMSLEELKRKFPDGDRPSRTGKRRTTPQPKPRPTMGAKRTT